MNGTQAVDWEQLAVAQLVRHDDRLAALRGPLAEQTHRCATHDPRAGLERPPEKALAHEDSVGCLPR